MANINSEDVGNRNKNEFFNGIKVIYINKRYTSASSIESGKNIFNNIKQDIQMKLFQLHQKEKSQKAIW